jgi:hypothetical protein
VLRLDGRVAESIESARAALELFRQKGDAVSARSTRSLIRELGSETAAVTEASGP